MKITFHNDQRVYRSDTGSSELPGIVEVMGRGRKVEVTLGKLFTPMYSTWYTAELRTVCKEANNSIANVGRNVKSADFG